jgi:hypothetical protein
MAANFPAINAWWIYLIGSGTTEDWWEECQESQHATFEHQSFSFTSFRHTSFGTRSIDAGMVWFVRLWCQDIINTNRGYQFSARVCPSLECPDWGDKVLPPAAGKAQADPDSVCLLRFSALRSGVATSGKCRKQVLCSIGHGCAL